MKQQTGPLNKWYHNSRFHGWCNGNNRIFRENVLNDYFDKKRILHRGLTSTWTKSISQRWRHIPLLCFLSRSATNVVFDKILNRQTTHWGLMSLLYTTGPPVLYVKYTDWYTDHAEHAAESRRKQVSKWSLSSDSFDKLNFIHWFHFNTDFQTYPCRVKC